MSTIAACGDVNRNTMCCVVDDLIPELPLRSRELAYAIAMELAPRSSAYFQVFLTDEAGKTETPMQSEEPIYGKQYLPRKFKVAIAHPHDNSVDALTNDVAFVPVVNGGAVGEQYDLYAGGGLGTTHGMPQTQALLALYLGPRAARAGRGRDARDRDPAEGARRAQGPPPGALEVHHPASGPRAS